MVDGKLKDWAVFSIDRGSSWSERTSGHPGLRITIKADPCIESFFKEHCNGESDALDLYGRTWFSIDQENPIKVYRSQDDPKGNDYTFGDVCGALGKNPKSGKVNLSFLKFVGIGSDNGVTFGISFPLSREFVLSFRQDLGMAIRAFVQDYIVPIHIELKIVSRS